MQPVFESVDTFTPEEFGRWVEERQARGDTHRYELLHGRIVMTPPAGWPHGEVESALCAALRAFVRAGRLGRVFGSSQGFELPSGEIVEPDVSFVSAERWDAAPPPEEGKFLRVVPDLVVEILSTATASRDRGEKRAIYERDGVREYWLVDPRPRRVSVLALSGARFGAPRTWDAEGAAESALLTGFRLPLEEIFP